MNETVAIDCPPPVEAAGRKPSWIFVHPVTLAAVAAGIALGFVYTLSPLTVWCGAASVVVVWWAGRGLPVREARWVRGLLAAAIAVRAVMVAALFLFGSGDHMWFNVFFGDEQYVIVRSLRLRHLWLGSPISLEALFDVFDLYGQTSYLNVIAYVQLLVGPAPYGIHLLNAVFYVCGVVVLHRLVRASFGRVAALGTFAGVLFVPTLVVWSASALKESLNFLFVTAVMAAAVAVVRAQWRWRLPAALMVVAGLAALSTFRTGALQIMALALAAAFAARIVTRRAWRLALAALVLSIVSIPLLRQPRVQEAVLRELRPAARRHMGDVFTRGHSYKLLDQRIYDTRLPETMTPREAARFVGRAAVATLFFPAPWHAQSRPELAYLPEQILLYVILLMSVIGFAAGLRRDALVTLLFAAYAAAALLAVAINTGNIGTLVRHRGFALPYLIALSAVGVSAIAARRPEAGTSCR
jgi:hypothetical protein